MSDIGLAGVSTTSLNKVGPSGETLPGSAFGGLDAFGGSGPQVGINDLGERVKDIDFKSLPNTDHIHFFGLYLGNYPTLSSESILFITDIINSS